MARGDAHGLRRDIDALVGQACYARRGDFTAALTTSTWCRDTCTLMGLWSSLKSAFGRNREPFFTPVPKDPAVVVKRFVVLVLMSELADSVALEHAGGVDQAIAMRKRTLDHLVALELAPSDLEPAEQRLAAGLRSGQIDERDAIGAMWRLECAGVLLWALGRVDEVLAVQEHVELAEVRSTVPADAAELRAFYDGARLRPQHELLAVFHQWSVKFFDVEHHAPSEARSRILERARAMRWLTDPALHELSAIRMGG